MTQDVTDLLSAKVRQLREQQGLRLEDLASRSGLALGTIVRIERGEGALISTVAAVATGLGVTISDLLGPGDNPEKVA